MLCAIHCVQAQALYICLGHGLRGLHDPCCLLCPPVEVLAADIQTSHHGRFQNQATLQQQAMYIMWLGLSSGDLRNVFRRGLSHMTDRSMTPGASSAHLSSSFLETHTHSTAEGSKLPALPAKLERALLRNMQISTTQILKAAECCLLCPAVGFLAAEIHNTHLQAAKMALPRTKPSFNSRLDTFYGWASLVTDAIEVYPREKDYCST